MSQKAKMPSHIIERLKRAFLTLQNGGQGLFPNEKTLNKITAPRLPTALFFGTVIFSVLLMIIFQHARVFSGEMYAEMAINYFPNPMFDSVWGKFFSLDNWYIALVPRIISTSIAFLSLNAACVPYMYIWSVILLSAVLVGAFCLPQFRYLVRSDVTRFLLALTVLIVADFETRTLLNFAYFGIFFVAMLTALAMTPEADDAPAWAWFMPFLMLSKLHILAMIPIMAIAFLVAKPRFRRILIASIFAGLVEFTQIYLTHLHGHGPGEDALVAHVSLLAKAHAVLKYAPQFLSGYFVGFYRYAGMQHHYLWAATALGCILFLVALGLIFCSRQGNRSLLITGVLLVISCAIINAFAITYDWLVEADRMQYDVPLYRHVLSAFYGTLFIVMAFIEIISGYISKKIPAKFSGATPAVLCIGWLIFTRWWVFGFAISHYIPFPNTGAGNWQKFSSFIDASQPPYCIAIDPYPWYYSKGCSMVGQATPYTGNFSYTSIPVTNDWKQAAEIPVPAEVTAAPILSVGVVLRPEQNIQSHAKLKVLLETSKGQSVTLYGDKELQPGGNVVMAVGDMPKGGLQGVIKTHVMVDAPVDIMAPMENGKPKPALMWFRAD